MKRKILFLASFSLICSLLAIAVYAYSRTMLLAVVFSIGGIALILGYDAISFLDSLSKKTPWYRARFQDGVKFLRVRKAPLDAVNVGSTSGVCAFSYLETPFEGENWAVAPQTLAGDFRILRNYFSYLKERAAVFLPLCPFSGCIRDFTEERYYEKYYLFLHPALIPGFSPERRRRVEKTASAPFRSSPLAATTALAKGAAKFFSPRGKGASIDFEADARTYLRSWQAQFSIGDLAQEPSGENADALGFNASLIKEMVGFCIERDLRPILVLPPVSDVLAAHFPERFLANYVYPLSDAARKSGAEFLDYFKDDRFADRALFRDSYLLNGEGARRFSGLLFADVFGFGR